MQNVTSRLALALDSLVRHRVTVFGPQITITVASHGEAQRLVKNAREALGEHIRLQARALHAGPTDAIAMLIYEAVSVAPRPWHELPVDVSERWRTVAQDLLFSGLVNL